jgi:MFS family permease
MTAPPAAPVNTPPSDGQSGAFAALRVPLFRAMWLSQFASNIGGWMQTVGAQWLMLSLTTAALPVSLIQTASSLPVLLFAVPAGALGDLVDRKRLILWTQALMLASAAVLGVLTIAGLATPALILALLFAAGIGQALNSPTWQTLQPELVPAQQRTQAIALGSVNQNLARAIGPAIGGALIVATGAGWLFVVNAVTFLFVAIVVMRWRPAARPPGALPPEHALPAIRAGGRYVANSPVLRAIMVRSGLFVFFASALWALLPLTARTRLGLGSGGYGLLLGAVGLGAVGGAFVLPWLRGHASADQTAVGASVVLGVVTLALALVHIVAVAAVALAVGGLCWILALATFNSAFQSSLPGWVKARGMGWYLIVFQGGNAIGSLVLGVVAQEFGLTAALAIAGGLLVLGPVSAIRFPLVAIDPKRLVAVGDWPHPQLPESGEALNGPILVQIAYVAPAERSAELRAALMGLRRSRRRTGASSWRLWRDIATPERHVESFTVVSWEEHLRQRERVSAADQDRSRRIETLLSSPPQITHLVADDADRHHAELRDSPSARRAIAHGSDDDTPSVQPDTHSN